MTRALVFVAVAGLLLTGLGALLDSAAFLRAGWWPPSPASPCRWAPWRY